MFAYTGGPIFDFVLDFFKQKTKAYKRNKKFNNTLKNMYLIKSKNFKTNMRRLKLKTKRRKEKLNPRLRLLVLYICLEFCSPLSCLYQAMQTRKKSSIT